jgi:hypothetical protein
VRAALVAIALFAGCYTPRYATVHGKRVERPSFGYTDSDLFAVEHHRAYPDVFGSDRKPYVDDGELQGRACGLELHFFSEWYGKMMTLYGRGSVPLAWETPDVRGGFHATLTIDDYGGGHRRIRGSNDTFQAFPIDIDVSAERLVAQIGTRKIDLHAQGHYLVGQLVQHNINSSIEAPFVIYGREMLRTMVPADEALILLLMITCNGTIEYAGRQERGFSLVSSSTPSQAAPDEESQTTEEIHSHGGPTQLSPSAAGGFTGGGGHR